MIIIEPSYKIESVINRPAILSFLEDAARTCYKSEGKKGRDTAGPFVSKLVHIKKHESVIEHVSLTVRFVCDRGVSHEIVRHRIAAYSQESTRYCNYSKECFGNQITVVAPLGLEGMMYHIWYDACLKAEASYFSLLAGGVSPQMARSVLPNSLKTELVMTANLREWRHILRLRTSEAAHPQMRQLMNPLLIELECQLPEIFTSL